MDIDLRLLRVFAAVVEAGGYSGAQVIRDPVKGLRTKLKASNRTGRYYSMVAKDTWF
jgi:hypothetical protein